ncbi:MAG: tyrosine-type recombinase/integrase [Nitratireductor sp.]
MPKYNADNELIKRKYRHYLQYADRKNEQSLDKAFAAISRFEVYTKYKAFKQFHIEQAVGFQRFLEKEKHYKTGKPLSKSTLSSILSAMKNFITWLAGQQGFKSRIKYSDADYFNLNAKDTAIAHAKRPKKHPSIEQILHVLKSMPFDNDIALRNRALIALTLLTEARAGALASFQLGDLDLTENTIFQDARHVNTKFSKSFVTTFCPVDELPLEIISHYVNYLRGELLFSPTDALFPKTKMSHVKSKGLQVSGLTRDFWQTTQPIREIFKEAFEGAGIAYYHPHSFRDTLAQHTLANSNSFEQVIAMSKNFGHSNVATMLNNYGGINHSLQNDLIRELRPRE